MIEELDKALRVQVVSLIVLILLNLLVFGHFKLKVSYFLGPAQNLIVGSVLEGDLLERLGSILEV